MSFVPAGDGTSDDDGHLLVLTHNLRTNTSAMLILDAKVRPPVPDPSKMAA